MSFDTLDVDVTDSVATIRLQNPPVNAIDQTMRSELNDLLGRLREDDIRVVVFLGTNEVFSVGADISLFDAAREWTTAEFRRNTRVLGEVFDGLESMEK
ncbi:MAG: enoyl-CoA hydratase/isomerase family protein, partial [Natronomonas sp.]|uniref:enoyl-CoA hydratase/isomerase family protein n=1 Tax=Natronomonas sp. TaxID=2184060 RepID=UPI0028704291